MITSKNLLTQLKDLSPAVLKIYKTYLINFKIITNNVFYRCLHVTELSSFVTVAIKNY